MDVVPVIMNTVVPIVPTTHTCTPHMEEEEATTIKGDLPMGVPMIDLTSVPMIDPMGEEGAIIVLGVGMEEVEVMEVGVVVTEVTGEVIAKVTFLNFFLVV